MRRYPLTLLTAALLAVFAPLGALAGLGYHLGRGETGRLVWARGPRGWPGLLGALAAFPAALLVGSPAARAAKPIDRLPCNRRRRCNPMRRDRKSVV